MFNDEVNYAYICFLKPIVSEVNKVNKNFEAKSADQTKLLDDLLNLLTSLVAKVTTPQSKFVLFKDNIDDFFDRNCYLGYLFEAQMKKMRDSGYRQEELVRDRCHSFLKSLIKEITNRVPDNVEMLKKISNLSVTNILKAQKSSIVEILIHFKKSTEEIAVIENQWYKIHLIKWDNNSNTTKFWSEVLTYKDSEGHPVFKELAEFVLALLTLPPSNADVERLFSQMNVVKNKLRNRLCLKTLNAILSIRHGMKRENKCCSDFDITKELLTKIKTAETYAEEEETDAIEIQDEDFEVVLQ